MRCEAINEAPLAAGATASGLSADCADGLTNVVRYTRRGAKAFELLAAPPASEVLLIDETTPEPPLAGACGSLRTEPRGQSADVFYIGPE